MQYFSIIHVQYYVKLMYSSRGKLAAEYYAETNEYLVIPYRLQVLIQITVFIRSLYRLKFRLALIGRAF